MDLGYRAEDILWLVEHGLLTLGYQSSSYLTDRVPELGLLDLPFLFETVDEARAAIDGPLGASLAGRIEERINCRILGYLESGSRHVPNRLRPVHRPADLNGMTIRVLPSLVQARTFELLGAVPLRMETAYDSWPRDLQDAMQDAVTFQRGLHGVEEAEVGRAIEAQRCEIVELTPHEHQAFAAAVAPIYGEARLLYGNDLVGRVKSG